MSSVNYDDLYNASFSEKKNICNKVSIFCAKSHTNNLQLLYKSKFENVEEEKIDENLRELFCYACDIEFNDVKSMRWHCHEKSHIKNSGWNMPIESDYSSDSDSDSKFINDYSESDENENAGEECTDESLIIKSSIHDSDIDDITFFKCANLTLQQACSFETLLFENEKNEIIGIKKCLLFTKYNKPKDHEELLKCVEYVFNCQKIAVFMYSGDCFAGAIFEENKQILHKSLRRYTTRKKQGGTQLTRDNRNATAPKSAGSQLRRKNAEKLQNDIHQLIHIDWGNHIDECGLILIWAAKNVRSIFSNCGTTNSTILKFDVKKDPRIRHMSGSVSRVNAKSLQQLFNYTITLEIFDENATTNLITEISQKPNKPQIQKEEKSKKKIPIMKKEKKDYFNDTIEIIENKKKEYKNNKNKSNDDINESSSDDDQNEEEISEKYDDSNDKNEDKEDIEIRTKFMNYVINDSLEDLEPYLEELYTSKSIEKVAELISMPIKSKNQSLLHLAINTNALSTIPTLLAAGCNPTHRNSSNETPYVLSLRIGNREACNIMKQHMFDNPQQFDYYAAKFPGGSDPLKELERLEEQKEKKKEQRKKNRERKKANKKKKVLEENERLRVEEFLSLSSPKKIQHIKKIQTEDKSFLLCFQCGKNIHDIVPFSYSDYHFCTIDCLKAHRSSSD